MEFKKAAFIGAGNIGTGLAANCIMHDIPVSLYTLQTPEEIQLCKQRINEILTFFVEKNVITAEAAEKAKGLVTYAATIEEAVKDADFIQEAVPEKLEIKQATIKEIESFAKEDAVISTSASGLSISAIFSTADHPERCVGGHPYLPAYLLPLIEVTKAQNTSDENAQKAMDFYKQIGKEPVLLKKEMIGFIANRFSSAIHRETVNLVMQGVCSVEDVDKALVYSLGIRWATMGQALMLHLSASPEGLRNFTTKYHWQPGQPNKRVADLANWTVFPEGWDKVMADGLDEAIANRPKEMGNTTKEIEAWRDDTLLEILRLHKMV